jgi:hypothetical protein
MTRFDRSLPGAGEPGQMLSIGLVTPLGDRGVGELEAEVSVHRMLQFD